MTENMEIALKALTELGVFDNNQKGYSFANNTIFLCVEGAGQATTAVLKRLVDTNAELIGGISRNGSIHTPSVENAMAEFEQMLVWVVSRLSLQAMGNTVVDADTTPPPRLTQEAEEPYLVNIAMGDVSHAWVLWYAKKYSVDNDYAWYQGMLKLIELNNKLTAHIGRSYATNIRHLSKPKDRK
jgi:hypothetical protein